MPSKTVLYSLHLHPLALFCKNWMTLLERIGAGHPRWATFASDGFVLQKCSTVTSFRSGIGFTPM